MKNFVKDHFNLVFILLILVLILTMIISVSLGASDISIKDGALILLNRLPIINNYIDDSYIKESTKIILLNIRMPRVLMASLCGSILSVVGGTFQGLFKNPMADPYVLGLSSGAALGASIAIILGLDKYIFGMGLVSIIAFIFSLITAFVVYNLSRVGRKVPTVNLLLSGISVSFFASSIISLIMILNSDKVEKIVFWTMGSLNGASIKEVIMLFIVGIIGITVIIIYSKDLNIITIGEESAVNLGVNTERVKTILIVCSALMISFCVSFTGVVGFVGLIIPHIVRILSGPNHKTLTLLSAVLGGIFLVICDTLSRIVIPPTEIPVGIITSLFGAPFFIYLLNKDKRKGM
ncbi:FecCD family ABC transporter permease [Clostridium sp.]|uniref:FecCD family ABC transporter permease n=1 Tax=Clostridium sp. TaxID=1506 RepID=UPI0034643B9B